MTGRAWIDGVTGVVLGGGRGTRLAPLTDRANKHLLPIGGEPLIVRVLRQLARAGVGDVLLVIDERDAGGFLAAVRDGRPAGLRSLGYAWQPAGGAGMPSAIAQVEHLLRTDRLVVACGDVLLEQSPRTLVEGFARQDDGARLLTGFASDTAGYTPVTVRAGTVTEVADKDPDRHRPGLIDLGWYCYRRDVFDRIRRLRPSARGETEIWELNRRYADEGRLRGTEIGGWWCDVGTSPAVYRAADERYSASDPTFLETGVRV